ncbi:hypothetical protein [Francisella philomiragia]|uniref:Uncharacterized protein n=1 Tax=Francisella philomiragia TaxID=28110 RepID=A0A0B6D4R4_9GAMM|nr:hypothetical protein [Francisella philomiragia]AJI52653.1 hypothetical protein LA55_926 [Francisella philomiragia]
MYPKLILFILMFVNIGIANAKDIDTSFVKSIDKIYYKKDKNSYLIYLCNGVQCLKTKAVAKDTMITNYKDIYLKKINEDNNGWSTIQVLSKSTPQKTIYLYANAKNSKSNIPKGLKYLTPEKSKSIKSNTYHFYNNTLYFDYERLEKDYPSIQNPSGSFVRINNDLVYAKQIALIKTDNNITLPIVFVKEISDLKSSQPSMQANDLYPWTYNSISIDNDSVTITYRRVKDTKKYGASNGSWIWWTSTTYEKQKNTYYLCDIDKWNNYINPYKLKYCW